MQEYLKARRKERILKIVAPIVFILLFLAIWEALVVFNNVQPWVIAKPTDIFRTLVERFSDEVLPNTWVTLKTLLIAYPIGALIGIAVAGLLSNSAFLASAVSPYIIFLVCTPMMTLVPLLMIAFGYGIVPRIIVVALQSFPIINMNCSVGFLNVPLERRELMQSMKASRLQTFFKVTLPSSVPEIFTGLRLGFIVSMTCCIGAEFAGGNQGLGAAIMTHAQYLRLPLAFSMIIVVAIIGVVVYNIISSLESVVKPWKD